MIEINKSLEIDQTITTNLNHLPFNLSDALLFDIETTGFSALTSQLYLIGVAYYQDNSWTLIQWLAETRADEHLLLDNFFSLAKNFKQLVHFNGDNFDVPYLKKKCTMLQLDYTFDSLSSFDLYKYFRKFKNFLPLEKFSLKSIEKHLGFIRRDLYSGGDLIQNYFNFATNSNKEDLDKLLLHNEDDLIGTIKLLPTALLASLLSPDKLNITSTIITNDSLTIQLNTYLPLPCTIFSSNDLIFELSGASNTTQLTLHIKLFKGVLKHFFPEYKDYYYLPLEDQAIHKSVAQFVDPKFKQKSKQSNCYIKLDSTFLPQLHPTITPFFSDHPISKITYFQLTPHFTTNTPSLLLYLTDLLTLPL